MIDILAKKCIIATINMKVINLKFNNKEVILFDLDGTLIDSAPDLAVAVNHMLYTLERATFSEDIIRFWVGNGAQVLVKRALSGQSNIDENLDPILFEKALEIFLTFYAQNLAVTTVTYPNVPSTLKTLKEAGYRLAIVTNKPFVFELHLGGDSLLQKKPDPTPLLHVCEKLNVTVEQCVMIHEKVKIAIVGGGVAGSSIALYLGQLGLNVTLFEKEPSLVSGPPFCHLHAGGNLYREISDIHFIVKNR